MNILATKVGSFIKVSPDLTGSVIATTNVTNTYNAHVQFTFTDYLFYLPPYTSVYIKVKESSNITGFNIISDRYIIISSETLSLSDYPVNTSVYLNMPDDVTALSYNTQYSYKVYIDNDYGTLISYEDDFTTISAPTISETIDTIDENIIYAGVNFSFDNTILTYGATASIKIYIKVTSDGTFDNFHSIERNDITSSSTFPIEGYTTQYNNSGTLISYEYSTTYYYQIVVTYTQNSITITKNGNFTTRTDPSG